MYFDNAATTELSSYVKKKVIEMLDNYGNPSSHYKIGHDAKVVLEKARGVVAKFINANDNEIYFTPGGSASNTMAIRGYVEKNRVAVLYSPIAHKSIIKCVESDFVQRESMGVYPLKVYSNGRINIDDLQDKLRELDKHGIKALVVVDYANSEIGTIQPVHNIVVATHGFGGTVYLDCTGSIASIPLDVKNLAVDMAGFSAHKLGGLKGCGVLYKRDGIEIEPLIYGSQEFGLVGGTENMVGICSLMAALERKTYDYVDPYFRDYLWNYISNHINGAHLIGATGNMRLPYNLYVCFEGVKGELLMTMLDVKRDYQVSTGSACNSGDAQPSKVLEAIGVPEDLIHNGIRITFVDTTDPDYVDTFCSALEESVEVLRRFGEK